MEPSQFLQLTKFHGDHARYVGLRIINNLLTALTLGLYYPWARAAELKYLYGETEYIDTRFVFHGTGREIFRGFIKAIVLFVLVIGIFMLCVASGNPAIILLGVVFYLASIFAIVPLAIHGSNRYRLSRTSWRGIHFGYRGKLGELYKIVLINSLLTLITFGLYGSWAEVEIKKYLYAHRRFGNVTFRFDGKGSTLFFIRLKGMFLMVITLGIYSFWFLRDLARFEADNIKVLQDGRQINARTTLTGGKIFGMVITNYLIVIFTLGIGTGIAINRILQTTIGSLEFDAAIDANNLVQTEEEYKDATGDDLAGLFDIPIV